MFDETIQPYFEGANLKAEETTVHKRIFIAFSDFGSPDSPEKPDPDRLWR